MKRVLTFALVLAVLGWAGAAQAVIGTIDEVPAATLLLPYFEVDLNNPTGLSTLIAINNASATAILAHVTIWSDLSVHVLDFNVYLTGYDVQTINLRDIIVSGLLPITASAGQDSGDKISPKGPFSQDINFASCNGFFPFPPGGLNTINPALIPHMQNALTGKPSAIFGGQCAGQNLGDNIARGYITVDTVNTCTTLQAGDPGYFGPGGIVTDQNVMWGDFFIVNVTQNFAQGGPLVHIEASGTDLRTTTPGNYTFYGRYDTPLWSAVDHREPLATTFATRYLLGPPFGGGTDLLVWRDSKFAQNPFACSSKPAWYPLGQEEIVIFDETEQAVVPPPCSVSPCVPFTVLPFPAETQRTHVGAPPTNGQPTLPVPFTFGWLFLDLNTSTPPGANPPVDPTAAQAWVISTYSSFGHFAVGVNGIQLDTASNLPRAHVTIP